MQAIDMDVPKEFRCPLTSRLMVDPVYLTDQLQPHNPRLGHSYERRGILVYLAQGGTLDPKSKHPIQSPVITGNWVLRACIPYWPQLPGVW